MRVGILTSGGDCQALNATMRGLVKALYQQRKDIEIIGFLKGYQGLMYEKYKKMSLSDFEDKDEKKYGLNGSPTQVERIFPPSNNDDHEIWTGDSSELSERMEDKLRELKFI